MKTWLLICALVLCSGSPRAGELPTFDGLIEPREVVDFSSQVPGIIKSIGVERGDWVKKGQTLAKLEASVEKAAVELATARVEFAKRKLVRNEKLFQKQLMSSHDRDELETEIRLGRLTLAEAQARLGLRTIRSTIDGVVVRRAGAPGEYVGEESFLTVAQTNPLSVELIIPDTYFGQITEGSSATVHIELPEKRSIEAKVVIVDDIIDAASSTFGVRLELPNPDSSVPAGMKCKVDL